MAEDENVLADGTETATAQKRPLRKVILIAGVALLLGGGGLAGWKFFLSDQRGGRNDTAVAEAKTADKNSAEVRIMYEMKPFIVNLLGDRGKRYLKAKIVAEVGDEAVQEELATRDAEIRDAILLLLAGKSFDDISTPNGKIDLRAELVTRLNSLLEKGVVRKLYFTEFVVQ
jgi:flagellar FliL protein